MTLGQFLTAKPNFQFSFEDKNRGEEKDVSQSGKRWGGNELQKKYKYLLYINSGFGPSMHTYWIRSQLFQWMLSPRALWEALRSK